MPTLYVVSTPIGNLEDISLRALRVLREVALIAAEDTRHTRGLLTHFDIATPTIAYHEHNKLTRLDAILARLADGADVALVSDAGTPGLSDPGYELIRAALDAGYAVDAVPGASSPLTALVLSGLPFAEFTYVGFPPRKAAEARAFFGRHAAEPRPLVLLEAPHRLRDSLVIIHETLGDRQLAVCRELTKLHQEVRRERVSAVIAHFAQTDPRGEFTIVIAPPDEVSGLPQLQDSRMTEDDVRARLLALRDAGIAAKEAVAQVTGESGLSRRAVYKLWLELLS